MLNILHLGTDILIWDNAEPREVCGTEAYGALRETPIN